MYEPPQVANNVSKGVNTRVPTTMGVVRTPNTYDHNATITTNDANKPMDDSLDTGRRQFTQNCRCNSASDG